MKVLSLFDGISCGRVALDKLGYTDITYFASEIDKYAIKVANKNYPDTIHIGDVVKVTYSDGVLHTENGTFNVGKIDLLLGGSPCQGFSLAGNELAFNDERSKLYFEYERLLGEIRAENPDVVFILENVKMREEYKNIITERLGVEPILINSRKVSAQNRPRLYWTNLKVDQPSDNSVYLEDILQDTVDDMYYIKAGRLAWLQKFGEVKEKNGYVAFNPDKAKCLTVRGEPSWNCTYILQWPRGYNSGGIRAVDGKVPSLTKSAWPANNLLLNEGMVRKLTPIECERLQTLPDNYTLGISDTQRYKALGNGWTVDVIVHILNKMKEEV